MKKANMKLVRHLDDIKPLEQAKKDKKLIKKYEINPLAYIKRQDVMRPSKESMFAKGEQTDSFGKQNFKQRMLEKSSPQVTAQSARSIRQDIR